MPSGAFRLPESSRTSCRCWSSPSCLGVDGLRSLHCRPRQRSTRRGRSTDEAIVEGLGHTGRLVTSAAIILFLAFAALASGPEVPIKVFATGMGVGILLDATVVRALLVPALVSLLGRRNWWLPFTHRASSPQLKSDDLMRAPRRCS